MAELEFKDLRFVEETGRVKVIFLNIYYFQIQNPELESIANFKVKDHSIEFECSEKKANSRFNQLLKKGFESLKCSIGGLTTVYIHKNSGIPLIGEGVFGLIDRNTNCIEVKPLTCCNLDCIFCSVDAGPSTRKSADFVVEEEYLVQEFGKLARHKEHDIEAHIGPQGEPLLYAPVVELIRDLKKIPKVKVISMDTNGTLLTKKLIDEMAEAGLIRLNISVQSLDEKKASMLAGRPYNLKHVLEMVEYASKKISVLLAPVIVPSMNDDQVEAIVRQAKRISSTYPTIGIQNFLNYKRGRNPAKARSWEEFYSMLHNIEKSENVKLKLTKEDFGIMEDHKLAKPMKKRDIVKVQVACIGPEQGEKIAVYRDRAIIVENAAKAEINSSVRVQIIRDKHNIFRGVLQ